MEGAPRPRRDDLYTEKVGGGLVVFDAATGRAHALGRITARVLQACDGELRAREIAAATGLSDESVAQALDELEASGLIETGPMAPPAVQSAIETEPAGAGAAALLGASLAIATAPAAVRATFVGISGATFAYDIAGETGTVNAGRSLTFDRRGTIRAGGDVVFTAGSDYGVDVAGQATAGDGIAVVISDATDSAYDARGTILVPSGAVSSPAPAGHRLTVDVSIAAG